MPVGGTIQLIAWRGVTGASWAGGTSCGRMGVDAAWESRDARVATVARAGGQAASATVVVVVE